MKNRLYFLLVVDGYAEDSNVPELIEDTISNAVELATQQFKLQSFQNTPEDRANLIRLLDCEPL